MHAYSIWCRANKSGKIIRRAVAKFLWSSCHAYPRAVVGLPMLGFVRVVESMCSAKCCSSYELLPIGCSCIHVCSAATQLGYCYVLFCYMLMSVDCFCLITITTGTCCAPPTNRTMAHYNVIVTRY